MKRILIAVTLVLCSLAPANAAVVIRNLRVEYRNTPLGIDVAQPRFSWQMAATAGERGYAQTAYQIEVKDPKGAVVWDSQRNDNLTFAGDPVRREPAPSGHPIFLDGDGVEPGGSETRRQLLVRDRTDGSRSRLERVGRREMDRRRE